MTERSPSRPDAEQSDLGAIGIGRASVGEGAPEVDRPYLDRLERDRAFERGARLAQAGDGRTSRGARRRHAVGVEVTGGRAEIVEAAAGDEGAGAVLMETVDDVQLRQDLSKIVNVD